MGKQFVRFRCHSCGHCCRDLAVLPTPFDVQRITLHTGRNPLKFLEFLTPEEVEEVEEDDPTWLDVNGQRYMMALYRDEDTGCTFLEQDTYLCGIYEARPILCRLYPFKIEETASGRYNGFSLHDDVDCPLHRDGQVATAPLHELYREDCTHQESYEALVKDFNARKYRGKEPEDFVRLFIDGV